jgi:alginate O-acetyltransferase complex protein AlgI
VQIGISFITFGRISYTVDVYRRHVEPARSLTAYLVYVLMFPKLTQGPIARYGAIAEQIGTRQCTLESIFAGIHRFSVGLAKKALIADVLSEVANHMFTLSSSDLSLPHAWLGAFCYTCQIYFDFSGYTDMAIGLGSILGFRLPENFDQPYISRNISEFWRRWHMTLSTWLRDYLFLPISYAVLRRIDEDRYGAVRLRDGHAFDNADRGTLARGQMELRRLGRLLRALSVD